MKDYLRVADKNDLIILYEWTNDPEVRKNSFSDKKITLEEHNKWFYNKLKSKKTDRYIYICEDVPVGQIRIDYENNIGTISYSIANEYRGHGLADRMLELAEEKVKENRKDISILQANVKIENKISQKKFENQGYSKYITYEKKMR